MSRRIGASAILLVYWIDGILRASLVEASVRRQTSIGQEIVWLMIFLGLFGSIAALAVSYAAAHRFNDRIAIALSAIFSGAIMIALRACFVGRHARRP